MCLLVSTSSLCVVDSSEEPESPVKKKATAAAETAKEVNSEARGDVDSSLLLLTKIVC